MTRLRSICSGRELAAYLAALALLFQAMMPLAAAAQQIQLDTQSNSPFAGGMVVCTAFGLKVINDPFGGEAPDRHDDEAAAGISHCVLSASAGWTATPAASVILGPGYAAASFAINPTLAADQTLAASFQSRAPPA